MGLVWFLTSFFLLATSSSFEGNQAEQGLNHSALHLTLYHVHGHGSPMTSQSPPSSSELFSHEQARVKYLNSKLTKNRTSSTIKNSTSHKSEHLFGPKFITTPLNPGLSIGVGNYYVKIGLGTPTSYYPVVIDTGSSLSWLQCLPCAAYCHKQVVPFFDPSASSTYKKLSCTTPECATLNDPACTSSNECVYTVRYGDKSFTQGYLSQDLLSLTQSETLPSFVYGCGQNNRGLFGQSAGLFGLSRNKLSMISQLSTKYGNDFSYCLPTAQGGSGGSLSIGSDSLMGPSYKFTPMLTPQGSSLYFLSLSAIAVAGKTLGVSEAAYKISTIIDSGTVITRLPTPVYVALRDEFNKIMSSKHETAPADDLLDTCYKGSLKEMSDVPEVRMVFQGQADLTLPPLNVLYDLTEEGKTCLALANNSAIDEKAIIIGNYQQQTYSVAYDVSNSRIGFAAGGCT